MNWQQSLTQRARVLKAKFCLLESIVQMLRTDYVSVQEGLRSSIDVRKEWTIRSLIIWSKRFVHSLEHISEKNLYLSQSGSVFTRLLEMFWHFSLILAMLTINLLKFYLTGWISDCFVRQIWTSLLLEIAATIQFSDNTGEKCLSEHSLPFQLANKKSSFISNSCTAQ